MRVADVITQIKALDAQEQAEVLDVLLEIKASKSGAYADDQSFTEAAADVLKTHGEVLRKLAE